MVISIYKFVIHNYFAFFLLVFFINLNLIFNFDLALFIIAVTMMSF